jgi:hypothetical protein
MADDMTHIVVNPLPPRRRDDVVARLAAPKDAADNAAAAGALPPGWVEVHNNPVGGPMYYAHLQTRATSWVLPAAEPPAGAKFFYVIEDSGETETSLIQAKDFVSLLASGQVTPDTRVYDQSLGEWTALRNVPALASIMALASNMPEETIEAPRERNEPNEIFVYNFVDDNSTLLDVACSFVFGVAVIPILVFAILTFFGFVMMILILLVIMLIIILTVGPVPIECCENHGGDIGAGALTICFLSLLQNAISHPSRRVAFGSGISLFVVAVVLLVLRRLLPQLFA